MSAAPTFEVLGRGLQDARAYLHAKGITTTGLREGLGYTASTGLSVRADLRTGHVLVGGQPVAPTSWSEATAQLYVDAVLAAVRRELS